jgi:hypothetical protein
MGERKIGSQAQDEHAESESEPPPAPGLDAPGEKAANIIDVVEGPVGSARLKEPTDVAASAADPDALPAGDDH